MQLSVGAMLIYVKLLPRGAISRSPPCTRWVQSRRFCGVSFSVRYPQYRTLSRPIGTGLPVALPRPNCKRPAQPRQLRHSALDRLRDMSCTCGRQRPGISTAPNPRGSCSRHACPGLFPTAVWRTIAQDRRGADNRPLDSKIKANRVCWGGRRESWCLHIGLGQGVSRFLAA